jgi:hypothetical protein
VVVFGSGAEEVASLQAIVADCAIQLLEDPDKKWSDQLRYAATQSALIPSFHTYTADVDVRSWLCWSSGRLLSTMPKYHPRKSSSSLAGLSVADLFPKVDASHTHLFWAKYIFVNQPLVQPSKTACQALYNVIVEKQSPTTTCCLIDVSISTA